MTERSRHASLTAEMRADQSVEHIDKLIREGQFKKAYVLLLKVSPSSLSRKERGSFASLARRIQKPLLALGFLRKTLSDFESKKDDIHSTELNVYVSSLLKLGSYNEAQRWLNQKQLFSDLDHIEVRARLSLHLRDYQQAIESYMALANYREPSSYAHLVDLVNLAASLISADQAEEALRSLTDALALARKYESQILIGNIHELMAQAHIARRDFEKAELSLDESRKHLSISSFVYGFYVDKWRFILQAEKEALKGDLLLDSYHTLIQIAQKRNFPEDHRDLGRFFALKTNNHALALKVYIGTPLTHYREQLLAKLEGELVVPDRYVYSFHAAELISPILDFEMLRTRSQVSYQLILQLLSDFYRPISVGSLFDGLYPGENFDAEHSPKRVYQNILRLRRTLDKAYPLGVDWQDNAAQLRRDVSCSVIMPLAGAASDELESFEREISRIFSENVFSRKEFESKLKLPKRTAQTRLREAVEAGLLIELGSQKNRKYQLKK